MYILKFMQRKRYNQLKAFLIKIKDFSIIGPYKIKICINFNLNEMNVFPTIYTTFLFIFVSYT